MPKTIFRSTEKSNFILNMTEEQYSKLASIGLAMACFMVSLFTIIPEITINSTYTIAAGGLAVSGVYCMIMAFIAFIKKYIKGGTVFPVCAFGAMTLWAVISLAASGDKYIGLYGFPQRAEGLLAIIFYFCIFVTGAAIKRRKAVETVIYSVIGTGILNSVFALVQIFTGKLSHYRMISLDIQTNSASGLAHSPLFLAMVLTLSLTAALISAVTNESKKIRVISIVSSLLFGFVMIMTYSFIGICGIAFSVIAAVITVFTAKASKKRLASLIPSVVGAVLAVVLVNAGVIGNVSSYRLYDGRELWWADSFMRIGSSGMNNPDVLDIDDTLDVYLYLNGKAMDVISENAVTGTGPDQLALPQIYTLGNLGEDALVTDVLPFNTGTFDRVYNEYLYTAATRGIPSLIALAAVILCAVFMSLKRLRKKNTAFNSAVFFLALGGALLFLIGCTNLVFSPIYWGLAGCACAVIGKEKADSSKESKK